VVGGGGSRPLATPICRVAAAFALTAILFVPASGSYVYLADLGAQAGSRWQDVANQAYSSAYQNSFTYQTTGTTFVRVDYDPVGSVFSGTLTARGLKPNFAYQIKLDGGGPEAHPTSNQNLGLAGRWWEQVWNGSNWSGGDNLNIQPEIANATGYPNALSLNDITYFDHVDDVFGSTAHPLYRHTGYLLMGYFVTDASGNATVSFAADDSYHVLFRANTSSSPLGQRTPTADDGPIVSAVFSAATSYTSNAYNGVSPLLDGANVDVFGQWERLPEGLITLPAGTYDVNLRLTEESFHGGAWTTVMASNVGFQIVPEPASLSLLLNASLLLLACRIRRPGAGGCAARAGERHNA
jgi:hypothetical protein